MSEGAVAPQATATPTTTEPASGAAALAAAGGEATPATTTTAPVEVPDWASGYSEEDKHTVASAQWADPLDAVVSYRNLRSLSDSGERLKLPTSADDAEGWREIHTKLGCPENAEGYDLPAVEAGEGEVDISEEFRTWAFEEGLSQKAAAGVFAKFTGHMNDLKAQIDQAETADVAGDLAKLQSEWGDSFKDNMAVGANAVKLLGLDENQQKALEGIMGTHGFIDMFHKMGRALGEHEGGSHGGMASVMTGDSAKAERARLLADPVFNARYMGGDTEAQKQITDLMTIEFPGQKEI